MIKFALLIVITMALWQLMHTWAHVGQLNRTSYAQVHNLWWSHCAKHIHIYVLYTNIIYLSIYVSIYLSVYLSIFVLLSIYLSTYLSIYRVMCKKYSCLHGQFFHTFMQDLSSVAFLRKSVLHYYRNRQGRWEKSKIVTLAINENTKFWSKIYCFLFLPT